MYSLDLNNCAVSDVIKRSLICHPTFLAGRLETNAAAHAHAMDTTNPVTRRVAYRLFDANHEAARLAQLMPALSDPVGDQTLERILANPDLRYVTFDAACKCQGIPLRLALDIMARSYPGASDEA